ncbi:MAG: hypothetical protein IT342_17850 [Candidatus Melainabacteria bacterium]|nr:hypothetical protein [Candidatus Melainabacteria bacterium]
MTFKFDDGKGFSPSSSEVEQSNDHVYKLFFTDVVAQDILQPRESSSKPSFKPASVDVENLLQGEFIFSDLSRDDLLAMADKAHKSGDVRKGQMAVFVADHSADVGALSQSGVFGISKSDLELYGKLLKANELSADKASGNVEGLKKVHEEHELSRSILPQLGSGVAVFGAMHGTKALAYIPEVNKYAMAFKAANPRTYLASLFVGVSGTWLASYYGGRQAGDTLNRVVSSEGINKHFTDEAAPAMKRLMEGSI